MALCNPTKTKKNIFGVESVTFLNIRQLAELKLVLSPKFRPTPLHAMTSSVEVRARVRPVVLVAPQRTLLCQMDVELLAWMTVALALRILDVVVARYGVDFDRDGCLVVLPGIWIVLLTALLKLNNCLTCLWCNS